MSHYLITGVAGFIASKVAECLLAQGHSVVGIDNVNDSYDIRLKQWRLSQLDGKPGFEFHRLDITDLPKLRAIWEAKTAQGFDAVINLAARSGVPPSVKNPWIYLETNIVGTLNLLEMCREYEVRKFVLASSSSLYGKGNPIPCREDADTNRPLSPYAASKKGAEALCHSYHHLHGIDITVFRYFTVYGPASRPDMSLFRFMKWITDGQKVRVFGDGSQTRDFTYVEDIAAGTIAGLRPLGFEVINLGSDKPIVLRDAISLLEELIGHKASIDFQPPQPCDIPASWASIEKARRLLDWRPLSTFRAGMTSMVEWYKMNRSWVGAIRLD